VNVVGHGCMNVGWWGCMNVGWVESDVHACVVDCSNLVSRVDPCLTLLYNSVVFTLIYNYILLTR